jgi:sarcosine oxidase subunit gamma
VAERSPLADRTGDLMMLGASELAAAQVDVRSEHALQPNTWTAESDVETIWLGPDQRLVVGPPERLAEIMAAQGDAGSVVDVSTMRAVIELPDEIAARVLRAGCGLDLDPVSWRTGMCAQTLLARVPVLLQRREGATRVFVRASFSEWLLDWMLAVAE